MTDEFYFKNDIDARRCLEKVQGKELNEGIAIALRDCPRLLKTPDEFIVRYCGDSQWTVHRIEDLPNCPGDLLPFNNFSGKAVEGYTEKKQRDDWAFLLALVFFLIGFWLSTIN